MRPIDPAATEAHFSAGNRYLVQGAGSDRACIDPDAKPQGDVMKVRMGMAVLALMSLPLLAHASCDSVKSGIDAKLKANGVSNYSLDVVDASQADKNGGKVVGQCEGNKSIVYTRGQAAAAGDDAGKSKAAPASSSSSASSGG
jgi:hypothetical protein